MAKKSGVEPKADDGMEREATVRFCPERRANYHLNRFGDRVYHGIPEGYEFSADGALVPIKEQANG